MRRIAAYPMFSQDHQCGELQKRLKREEGARSLAWSGALFFLQFNQDHQEWLVDVAPHGKGNSAPQEAQGLPFEGLVLHLDHTDEVLSIIVRQNDITQEHVYQSVPRPRCVMIESTGADVRLHIDSTGGFSTIIRFRCVVTPDYAAATLSGIPERSP